MRRLLALLLLVVGIGALAPCPPLAAAMPHHAGTTMPGGCHDDGAAAPHACIGCAIAPEPATPVSGQTVAGAVRYPIRVAAAPVTHRTGFDPPPPRAAD